MEVQQDAAQLGVVAEVREGRVPAGDEHARERRELLVRDTAERARAVKVVLAPHARDELLVAVLGEPVAEVRAEGALRERVDVRACALRRGELRGVVSTRSG